MSWYPYNEYDLQKVQTSVPTVSAQREFLARYAVPGASADAPSTNAVLAAVADNGLLQTITAGIANPPSPRQITATSGGTAANITATQVTITGTDFLGNAITETLPAFTAGAAGTVSSTHYFATVTEILQPPIGTGVTVSYGYGAAAGAAAASTNAVLAAVADDGALQTITTGLTSPTTPRNVTATVGGTAANITATQVTVTGTDYAGNVITETLPAFTAATAGTVTGSKAFATVTQVSIPACGTGVTTAIGFGDKLGLPFLQARNQVLNAYLGGVKEATAPTVTTDHANLCNNTVALNSVLNGAQVDVLLAVP